MKKHLVRIVFLAACLLISSTISMFGKSVQLTLFQLPLSSIDDEEDPFGHRVPSRPITGIIDFDSNEIILSRPVEDIELYEIWNEEQTVQLYSGNDESEFIQILSGIDCAVSIALHSSSYILTGTINPS